MKVLKKLLSFILSVVLYILILVFSLNLVIKGVVQKQIIGGFAKDQIINEYIDNQKVENKDEIKKVLQKSDALKVANSVVDEYLIYVTDNTHKVSKKTVQGIIDFFVNNREDLNKISKTNVSEEELKSQKTFDELEKALNDGFEEVNVNLGETPTEVLKIYSNLTSNNFQILLIISIVIVIILLMIVKNSLYKWMSTLGSALISVGIMISGLYVALTMLVDHIMKSQSLNVEIKLDSMLTIGILEIVIGIILILTKFVISKIQETNKKSPVVKVANNTQATTTTAVEEAQPEVEEAPTEEPKEENNLIEQ